MHPDASRDEQLRRIITDVVEPNAKTVDEQGVFPTEAIRALGKAGFLGLSVPVDLGGAGASASEFSHVVIELAKACASTAMVYVMHVTALNSIIVFADEAQRERYLRPVLAGDALVTEAISEAGTGSQWWSVASTSEKTATGYRIDAKKSFVTSAGHADIYVVSTRCPGSDNDRDHALFVVSGDPPGVSSGQWHGLGLSGNSSTWMNFACELEEEALLFGGGDGTGLRKYNEVNQPWYHLGVASAYLGIGRAAYEACVGRIASRSYTAGATSHGTKLSAYPVARRHVGTMAIRLAAGEGLVARLAAAIDAGASLDQLAVVMTAAKVSLAEAAADVAREAMMASGGSAYARGPLPIERHLRDALAASLMGPNDDFCKELIGRLELGDGSYHDL